MLLSELDGNVLEIIYYWIMYAKFYVHVFVFCNIRKHEGMVHVTVASEVEKQNSAVPVKIVFTTFQSIKIKVNYNELGCSN